MRHTQTRTHKQYNRRSSECLVQKFIRKKPTEHENALYVSENFMSIFLT